MCHFFLSKNLSLAFEKNISTPQKQNYTLFWFLVCFTSFYIPEKGYQNEETKSSPYLVSSARVVKLFYKFVKNFLLFFFPWKQKWTFPLLKKYVYTRNEIIRLLVLPRRGKLLLFVKPSFTQTFSLEGEKSSEKMK